MTIELINTIYGVTLLLAFAAMVSGIAVLAMGSKRKNYFFQTRPFAYVALNASILINGFFIYNILLWLSSSYVEIQDLDFHLRWLIYHTIEKAAIFLFHHELYRRVKRWRAEHATD